MSQCTMPDCQRSATKYGGQCDQCWNTFVSPHDVYVQKGMCASFKGKVDDLLWCNQKADHSGSHTTNPNKIAWPR